MTVSQRRSIRGEQQPGFLEVLTNWLPHQPWCPGLTGRRSLARVGGLRLPAPEGDADSQLFLELHVFEVEDAAQSHDQPVLISVPLALRSRPSTLAGKAAFIGKLSSEDGNELWVYDGARDRAFLAAIIEMARRRQGSRNGRSRGEALAGFEHWDPLTVDMRRHPAEPALDYSTRTLVQPAGTEDEADWEKKVAVDILRRPSVQRDLRFETVFRLTAAHSTAVSRVLGTVTGAWQEHVPGQQWQDLDWDTGELVVIRESAAAAPEALSLARTSLRTGKSFASTAQELGHTLGDFHADLAGAFGAHPQATPQLKAMAARAQNALQAQWKAVRHEFDEDEAADLHEVIDLMTMQLRDSDEPLLLQRIHGDVTAAALHRLAQSRWVVSEAGGFAEHELGMQDVITVLMSLANMVMEEASEASVHAEGAEPSNGESSAGGGSTEADGTEDVQTQDPVNYGQWYEEVSMRFLQGYRSSDADTSGIDSVFFRAAMLTASLELFSRWEGSWVFRPSMLLQVQN